MQTSDAGLLFQTSAQVADGVKHERKVRATAKIGAPLLVAGKVLDFAVAGNDVFVAESGWQARRIALDSGKTLRLYKGHSGPVTAVTPLTLKTESGELLPLLFTASWDKSIRVWHSVNGELLHIIEGHTDFVKSLTVIPHSPSPLLLSTSSDRTIRLWDLGPLLSGQIPVCLQTIKRHTRPVDCAEISVLPGDIHDQITVWTGDSLGVIHEWMIEEAGLKHVRSLAGHETSVTDLKSEEDGLWSVSMDKSAIFHPRDPGRPTVLAHPTYVHSILPISDRSRSLVLTGSDDEDLRLWELGDEGVPQLVSQIQGHCGAISAIRLWKGMILTSSLDGTLRRWSIKELLEPVALNYTEEEESGQAMTEEEERELAELMED